MNCEATNQIKGKKQIHRKTHSRKKVSEKGTTHSPIQDDGTHY